MSKLKLSENLFLGLAELERFQRFLDEDGFKRHTLLNVAQFGIIEEIKFPVIGNISKQEAFYVSKLGTPFDEVSIGKGVAINLDGNLIVNKESQQLRVPSDSLWYWIKISHELSTIENGTVSIDQFGNVTGVGTEFTNILRGQPNYPSRIKFLNTISGNVDEYEVVKVIDDTNCVISGDFNIETNLQFSVVGTFTPGYAVPAANKNIFRYDSVKIELIPETAFNQEPAKIQNREFYLARVRNNGIDLTLQDKRKEWWRSEAFNYLRNIDRIGENPLIGVESVQYDLNGSPRHENIINLAFGFRTSSYTIDTAAKKISILIGNGGIYKDTSFFQSGNFNGWRIYKSNGDWDEIVDSQKTGTQIVITLDVLNPNDFIQNNGTLDQLLITPPFEEVEVRVRRNGAILDEQDLDADTITDEPFPFPLLERNFLFPINTPVAKFKIPVVDEDPEVDDNCYKYNLTYRYKVQNDYTGWKVFPNDPVGYYDEKSFDVYGNLSTEPLDRTLKPYDGDISEGFIEICEHPFSFQNFQNLIVTGDIFGVNTTALDNAEPVVQLFVGTSKKYQHYKGELNLEADLFINLNRSKLDGSDLREGNEFILHLEQFITLNDFSIKIVEDFVNPTSFTTIAEITSNEIAYIKNNTKSDSNQSERRGLFVTCTFNDNDNWIAHFDSDTTPTGSVRLLKGISASNFNSSGDGVRQGYWGWKIIEDQDGRVAMGTASATNSGQVGGVNTVTLTALNLPRHNHEIRGRRESRNTSGGGFKINQVFLDGPHTSGSVTNTSFAGGDASGQNTPASFNPKHMKFLMIEKIV